MDHDTLELSPSAEDFLLLEIPAMSCPPFQPKRPTGTTKQATAENSTERSAGNQNRAGSTAPVYPPRTPTSSGEEEVEIPTVEGFRFRITYDELDEIPFGKIRESKKKRYTVYLRNGDSVKVKLIGFNAPLYYSYKARSNRTRDNRI